MKKIVKLKDGSNLEVGLIGNPDCKVIMLPIAKKSVYGKEAENLKLWGIDPELGMKFIQGLSDKFQVLYFDYEGHLFEYPNPDHLSPENITNDFLLIADSFGVECFSYYGYSWLALVGLQLAIRTKRLDCLIMGGYPPYEGPYKEMMIVTEKTYEQALHNQGISHHQQEEPNPQNIDWDNIQVEMKPNQTKQFVTLYKNLMDFDDEKMQEELNIPRLTFAGQKDTIVYGENFGTVTVDIIGLLQRNKKELERLGWDVEVLRGNDMDHTKAMQPAAVLPLIKSWLIRKLLF